MQVEIPCEKCRVALRVPPEAAGHRARCPACGHTFVVPRVEQLLEETVSSWIEEDIEDLFENREREIDQRQQSSVTADAVTDDSNGNGTTATATQPDRPTREHHEPPHPQPRRQAREDHSSSRRQPPDRRLWPARPMSQPAVPGGVALPGAGAGAGAITSGDPDIEILTDPVKPRRSSPPPEQRKARVTEEEPDDPGDRKGRYPRNLHVDERVPHLVVHKVDAAGVHFAFDSAWLNHEGFRASMAVRCAFSGATAREKLIARPMVFMDRVMKSASASLEQIVGSHENRTIGDHTSRELARSMGVIESMPHPFAYAMPYFVATKFSHLSLHCRTRDRLSGGITCEVLIPDAACALDWLARVNGVCGEEFHLLEQDVSLLHGDAWQGLSDDARQRIEVWCKLQPREVMRHYFPDADFGRRDEGLAGLVVTDQRLVFCKYHHKGQVGIDTEDAQVIAKPEGKFASLTLRTGSDLQRMVKLQRNDVGRLADALKSHGAITLHVAE